ncbi:MAG: hypothetical protein IT377_27205 [Polyangiaceae bacterium]|nr:hypothetical protein [Polyangiaceae bacterium]
MTRSEIQSRARALGLSANATAECLRLGLSPDRFAAFYSEMQSKSPQGVVATRRAQGQVQASIRGRAETAERETRTLRLGLPHRVGERAKPEPSEFERRVEALEQRNAVLARDKRLGPLPQVSASMRERCLARGIDPDQLAAFRRDMRRGAA